MSEKLERRLALIPREESARQVMMFRLPFDVNEDGVMEDIVALVDVKTQKLLYYAYAENLEHLW